MRLNQIRFFLAVVDAGSIRGAARRLGVSPPAITKGLRQFEDELHVRLFERTQHGVVATPMGRAFVARARAIQAELRKAEEEFMEFSGGPAGSVAIGAGPSTMLLLAAPALPQFRRQFPETRVRIIEGLSPAMVPLVRDQTLDFALMLRPEGKPDSAFRFRPLFQDYLAIAARRGHPLRNEQSLGRLAAAEWLTFGPNWAAPARDRLLSDAGVKAPRSSAQCDSFTALVALLAESDMVAAIPSRLLATPLGRAVLQQIPVAVRMPSNVHGILTRADEPLSRAAAALARVVTHLARQLARRP